MGENTRSVEPVEHNGQVIGEVTYSDFDDTYCVRQLASTPARFGKAWEAVSEDKAEAINWLVSRYEGR